MTRLTRLWRRLWMGENSTTRPGLAVESAERPVKPEPMRIQNWVPGPEMSYCSHASIDWGPPIEGPGTGKLPSEWTR